MTSVPSSVPDAWPFVVPVLTAAGCGGTGRDLAAYGELRTLGGFVTRSLTLQPRPGTRAPRIVEAPSGFVNAIGLQNPGVTDFLDQELPTLLELGAVVVVSIAGRSLGEYTELVRTLGRAGGVTALELNLSVPDPEGGGVSDFREPFQVVSVVAACRRDLPRGVLLLAKLRADALRVVEHAHAAMESGADAVVIGNAQPAVMPDGRIGGLSGPAVRPLALRCVAEVCRAMPDTAVIGSGGIVDVDDARAFLDAGARAVQVGSALFHDPTVAFRIAATLRRDDPDDEPHGDPGDDRDDAQHDAQHDVHLDEHPERTDA